MLRLKRLICDKRGIGAIWTVVLLACLIPVFIFGFIDIPYYMRVNRKIKNTVDNIAASAVTYLNENALREGIALLDRDQAEKYVLNELKIWYGVNCNGAPVVPVTGTTSKVRQCKLTEESLLPADPYIIEVKDNVGITDPTILNAPHIEYVIHEGALDGMKYKTKQYKLSEAKTSLQLKYPSVVVTFSAKIRGLMLGYPVKMIKTGYSHTGVSAESGSNIDNGFADNPGSSADIASILSSINATIRNGYVMGFTKANGSQYTITEILNMLQDKLQITFKTSTGTTLGGGPLRNGCILSIKNTATGSNIDYTVIVFGDVNGDGNISNVDLQAVKNHIAGSTLEGIPLLAADVNHDGKINNDDVNTIDNHIKGKIKIEQVP